MSSGSGSVPATDVLGPWADAAPGPGPLRVFALQYRLDVEHLFDDRSYAAKMDELFRTYVVPGLRPDKTALVVLGEHLALGAVCAGERGHAARANWQEGIAQGTADAFTVFALAADGHEPAVAAYNAAFPDADPRKAIVRAATDTFVRVFAVTFSALARRYGVYVAASNVLGDVRFSRDADDRAAFADSAVARDSCGVWVATNDAVWNQAFLWGPQDTNDPEPGASAEAGSPDYDPCSNLVATNRKTPLTDLESEVMGLDAGDLSEANTGPVVLPELPAYRLGFAISLPAFRYGNHLGEPLPSGSTCSAPDRWMRCLDARGVNVVLQPEANAHPWAAYGADGDNWQALTWGASTLRAATDPTVGFRYCVCAHMVGNLADIVFDGQTAITMRNRRGPGRAYVGADRFIDDRDDPWTRPYAGKHPQFLTLTPWALADEDGIDAAANRARLATRAEALAPGSGSEHENDYVETAIYADLDEP